MKKFEFEYGAGTMSAELPDNTDVFVPGVTVPDPPHVPEDKLEEAYLESIHHPIGMDPLDKLANKDSNARVLRFASGGYTGSWNGEQGKLALLDKKELVLNEYDTQNLLSSVDIIRSVVDQIDLQTMANTISGLTSATIGNIDNSSSVDQNVVISADFPNVSSRDEIEAAFDNLINRAAQYSYRNK